MENQSPKLLFWVQRNEAILLSAREQNEQLISVKIRLVREPNFPWQRPIWARSSAPIIASSSHWLKRTRCKLLRDHVPLAGGLVFLRQVLLKKKERRLVVGPITSGPPWGALCKQCGRRWTARCTSIATSSTPILPAPVTNLKIGDTPGCLQLWLYISRRECAQRAAGTKINARRRSDQFRITALCGSFVCSHFSLSERCWFSPIGARRSHHVRFSGSQLEPLSPLIERLWPDTEKTRIQVCDRHWFRSQG